MVRKRTRYDRQRDRLRRAVHRPKARPPTEGWLIAELTALTGVKPRTIRHYVGIGLLLAPELRGTATRYDRGHLLRLVVIKAMRLAGNGLAAIKHQIGMMAPADLEAFVARAVQGEALATALGITRGGNTAALGSTPLEPTPTLSASDQWAHWSISPRLQVLMRGDASPVERQLLEDLKKHYGISAS